MVSSSRQRPKLAGVLAGVLAFALVLAACSSEAKSEGSPANDRPESSTTQPVEGTLDRYADYESREYGNPEHWLCRPDTPGDVCDVDLDATAIQPDGTATVEEFAPDVDASIDCFYVYPTVSADLQATSDWNPGEHEEINVTLNQAARLQSSCRLFVPLYRQITRASLTGGVPDGAPIAADAYADVLDAFRTYMAQENVGRGFVLVGHSQGTLWLNRLLREEIDPNRDVREQLVGAYLAGGRVAVPPGDVVGGDLANVPLCTSPGEFGCVTTWSSVLPSAEPLTSRSAPTIPGCVNPAAPGVERGDTDAYFASDIAPVFGRAVDGENTRWPSPDAITTPFVRLSGRFSAACRDDPGGSRLVVSFTDDPADSTALPGGRGADLHLLDVNLVMGNVVEQVRRQSEEYTG